MSKIRKDKMEHAIQTAWGIGHETGYRKGYDDGYEGGEGNGPGHMYDDFENWKKHQPDPPKGLPT